MIESCRHGALPGITCLDCIGELVRAAWAVVEHAERMDRMGLRAPDDTIVRLREALTDEPMKSYRR